MCPKGRCLDNQVKFIYGAAEPANDQKAKSRYKKKPNCSNLTIIQQAMVSRNFLIQGVTEVDRARVRGGIKSVFQRQRGVEREQTGGREKSELDAGRDSCFSSVPSGTYLTYGV